ncbi:MAG: carbohydrate kinase family protein [Patescibacteria group bacterium]|nr:carbohydrate kinase family protein [Patescibacteria group bacterium]
MKNNILVCGALAYDRIMDFPGKFSEHILAGKEHILNLSFTVNGVKKNFGGTGGNIAYNLAMLGERPKVVAVVGKDFAKYKKWLKKNKIDISGVKIAKDEMTAKFYVITDQDDNQISAYYPGSLDSRLRGNDKGKSGNYKLAIIAPDIVARMVEYAKIFRRNQTPYIFDPGQQAAYYTAKELKYSIKGAKMLIGNDYEIRLVLNKLKIKQGALEKMVEILAVTKGGKGAEIYHKNKKIVIPAAKKKVFVDPTGAGDAFRAGFIKGMIMNWPLEKCARLGMIVSAYAVESQGTQAHRFTWREVEKRYRENYHEEL